MQAPNQRIKDRVIPTTLIIITATMVTAALYAMKPVLVPFVFSIFLLMLVSPLIEWFQSRLKMPRYVAMGATFILMILTLVFLIMILGVSIRSFIKSSSEYQMKLLNLVDQFALYALSHGYKIDLSVIRQTLIELPILKWVTTVSTGVVGIVSNIVLVFIFTTFLLIGKKDPNNTLLDQEVTQKITRYISTKFMTSASTGILIGLILGFSNVPLAWMFGILTFFLNFIPNVGSIVATLLPIPIIFLQFGFGISLLVITILTASIQFFIGSIVDPKLMGDHLGLHPAIILLSLLFWGFIWGVPGMFLSVPITAVAKLILERSRRTRPLALLLEGKFKAQ